jgi:hypothetical protein
MNPLFFLDLLNEPTLLSWGETIIYFYVIPITSYLIYVFCKWYRSSNPKNLDNQPELCYYKFITYVDRGNDGRKNC